MATDLKARNNSYLQKAIEKQRENFQIFYDWLEKSMPPIFFEEISQENLMLIVHNLMGFDLQDYFSTIHLKNASIVLCLNNPDADLRILKNYSMYGIKNYQTYVSKEQLPFPNVSSKLRIAMIYFTEAVESELGVTASETLESKEELRTLLKEIKPDLSNQEFERLSSGINNRFLHSIPKDGLILALDMLFRAKERDNCQYEVRYDHDWKQNNTPSMQIVLAWRNTPKHNFLYRLARVIHRHGLVMRSVNATYIDPYSKDSILVMALGLHGSKGEAAWEASDIPDFLRELVTVKYYASFDGIDQYLVSRGLVTGTMGNFLRCSINFIHQILVHIDSHLYTADSIEEAICRHPELTSMLCEAFKLKFDPDHTHYDKFLELRNRFIADVSKLDTGHVENDLRRKNVLLQGMNFIHHILKTNFYRHNYTSISFRLDPKYLDYMPFDRTKKFPELPFAIFFIKGMHFFGFHIRFKDLSRGGLRTVYPEQVEQMLAERNTVFTECYNLAITQHKKNKDIPEGGAKGIIFLRPFDRLESESAILQRELHDSKITTDEIQNQMELFRKEQKTEYLYQAQRSFIEGLITIVNCDPDGKIRAKYIVDYWNKPEYLYLGPDENMHDPMIEWIANLSKKYDYKPGGAFISGKPNTGINHKEYGVTSLGVNVYMQRLLEYIGINPEKNIFTVKMSGGPDGDVAGNQILNLHKYYDKTAKLVALTDATGTIFEPNGLDLSILADLFPETKGIRFYPPEKLSEGGFLVDRQTRRLETAYVQQTLCWRKSGGKLIEDWLSGSDMNNLFRNNLNVVKADIFIPAGGRPRTLNESNVNEFIDETGKPTARAIVEGANLYFTPKSRLMLEELGVLIIKDSSANKTGVICSSFEVLCGLTLTDKEFLAHKTILIKEIKERLVQCAENEAQLLLRTHKQTGYPLTEISDMISKKINQYTYELLDYFQAIPLSADSNDPLFQCFLNYSLPTLRNKFKERLIKEIPENHKKAIIACYIASNVVYKRGLGWSPTIVDILPSIHSEKDL